MRPHRSSPCASTICPNRSMSPCRRSRPAHPSMGTTPPPRRAISSRSRGIRHSRRISRSRDISNRSRGIRHSRHTSRSRAISSRRRISRSRTSCSCAGRTEGRTHRPSRRRRRRLTSLPICRATRMSAAAPFSSATAIRRQATRKISSLTGIPGSIPIPAVPAWDTRRRHSRHRPRRPLRLRRPILRPLPRMRRRGRAERVMRSSMRRIGRARARPCPARRRPCVPSPSRRRRISTIRRHLPIARLRSLPQRNRTITRMMCRSGDSLRSRP